MSPSGGGIYKIFKIATRQKKKVSNRDRLVLTRKFRTRSTKPESRYIITRFN